MLPRRVELKCLARQWGVTEIETKNIDSEALLLPGLNGYKIVLKDTDTRGGTLRQRFSLAHELGHLLLRKVGYLASTDVGIHHRTNIHNDEERICDQIAAEILMPRRLFVEDANRFDWDLGNLQALARLYDVSIPATARRMIDLTDETCLMGVWKPATVGGSHSLEQWYSPTRRFGVPSPTGLPSHRLGLIDCAGSSRSIESGTAPIVDRKRPRAVPADVPAKAWAWSRGEFRKVMVFYYPSRSDL